jgi:adenine deaminase
MKTIKGKLVDIIQRDIYNAIISIEDGKIQNIQKTGEEFDGYLLPGFIDSHVHIESSMLKPSEFAKMAVKHGTVATVSDPHEIANVCGLEGILYMIRESENVPVKIHFTAPSCVPATEFEKRSQFIIKGNRNPDERAQNSCIGGNDELSWCTG